MTSSSHDKVLIDSHRLVCCPFCETPNHGGEIDPVFVVLHYTGSFDAADAIEHLCDADSGNRVSAHVVLDRDGTITQLAPFNVETWHAGRSSYVTPEQTYESLNRFAIGIELVNPGWFTRGEDGALLHGAESRCTEQELQTIPCFIEHPLPDGSMACWATYPAAQLASLEQLICAILTAYPHVKHIVGHEDIVPIRKVDPGPAFPMARFERLLAKVRNDGLDLS